MTGNTSWGHGKSRQMVRWNDLWWILPWKRYPILRVRVHFNKQLSDSTQPPNHSSRSNLSLEFLRPGQLFLLIWDNTCIRVLVTFAARIVPMYQIHCIKWNEEGEGLLFHFANQILFSAMLHSLRFFSPESALLIRSQIKLLPRYRLLLKVEPSLNFPSSELSLASGWW